MRLHPLAPLCLALTIGVALLDSSASSAATKPGPTRPDGSRLFIDGKPDTGQFLPDTFVVCRVGARKTNVKNYVWAYFDSYAEFRPKPDSAGRVQFLTNIIQKDVMGQVALEVNRPIGFEDRVQLRETEQRSLSNALYRSAVLDSLNVTDADIMREYELFKIEVHLRHIVFTDSALARKVKLDLQRGRIGWKEAYNRYSITKGKDHGPDGDVGWKPRAGVTLDIGRALFTLPLNGISDPILDDTGWNLLQVVEKREVSPISYDSAKGVLRDQLMAERTERLTNAVRATIRRQIDMTYDFPAIAWASSHFTPTRDVSQQSTGPQLEFNTSVPEFAPDDTARVLARYRDGKLTLGGFMHAYTDIQPLLRPSINTPDAFQNQVDAVVFEPYMAQVARERGLDRDSLVVAELATRREQLLVEHLYSDSILSHVAIDPKARRKYYQDHLSGFITWAKVRFAALWAENKPQADSLAARLNAGEKAEDIIRADSLLGIQRGSIQERLENEHGPYQKLLFEMLRPGKLSIEGPDREGHYGVVQELEYVPGRQLSYDEASGMIDESLQNIEAERLLTAFIDRHKKRYKIESRPDMVMRIRLVDPAL